MIVPAVLGPSPQVGDETFAVGNPLGLVGSLSAGVISGLDRTFKLANGRTLSGMIQFDAAVNPGSSGGPLLNTKGQVIGIVTGLANASRDRRLCRHRVRRAHRHGRPSGRRPRQMSVAPRRRPQTGQR